MVDIKSSSRRKFLLDMAKAGIALPFAGQLLGQNAFAAGSTYKNILFIYHPNGVQNGIKDGDAKNRKGGQFDSWNPVQGTGPITTSGELSFALGPLQPWHNNIIVLKNIYIDKNFAGFDDGGGGHEEPQKGVLTGDCHDTSATSIDHLIAEKLGNQGVLNVGARTGTNQKLMVSKPRNTDGERGIPNNNPFDVATKLKSRVSPIAADPLQGKIYEATLADMSAIAADKLVGNRQSKLDQHQAALERLKNRQQEGTFKFPFDISQNETVEEASKISGSDHEKLSRFPLICKAHINNIVAAFGNGLHRVATLQLGMGNEHFINYSFDECWAMNELAVQQGKGNSIVGKKWDNQHLSHTASHYVDWAQTHGQVRWHVSLLAYVLSELKSKELLDETLVVMFSEEGNGVAHTLHDGSIIVAGGANAGLQMGRVIDCASTKGTHHLFGDLARWVGAPITSGPWKSGII